VWKKVYRDETPPFPVIQRPGMEQKGTVFKRGVVRDFSDISGRFARSEKPAGSGRRNHKRVSGRLEANIRDSTVTRPGRRLPSAG